MRILQGKKLREDKDLKLGNIFQGKSVSLEPPQGQRHNTITNPRSILDRGERRLMIKDPIKVGYLSLSNLCRSVSKHPRTKSGTLTVDARDT